MREIFPLRQEKDLAANKSKTTKLDGPNKQIQKI